MTQLWLVPATDEPSFQETLARPRDLTEAPDKPDKFPDEARVWGVLTDPKQGTWERNRRNLERMTHSLAAMAATTLMTLPWVGVWASVTHPGMLTTNSA